MNLEREIRELRSAVERLSAEVRQLRNEVMGQGVLQPSHWIPPAMPPPQTLPWPEITCERDG